MASSTCLSMNSACWFTADDLSSLRLLFIANKPPLLLLPEDQHGVVWAIKCSLWGPAWKTVVCEGFRHRKMSMSRFSTKQWWSILNKAIQLLPALMVAALRQDAEYFLQPDYTQGRKRAKKSVLFAPNDAHNAVSDVNSCFLMNQRENVCVMRSGCTRSRPALEERQAHSLGDASPALTSQSASIWSRKTSRSGAPGERTLSSFGIKTFRFIFTLL